MKVDAIIPAYNEEFRIVSTIKKLKKHKMVGQIYVVDDGSSDGTVLVASNEGAIVFPYVQNKGKGYAVRYGLEMALKDSKAKYFLVYDADGSSQLDILDWFKYSLMVKPDLLITSRNRTGSKVVNDKFTRRLSSSVFRYFVDKYLGLRYSDTQNGAVFFNRRFAREFVKKGTINGFCYTLDYLMLVHEINAKIVVLPVTWVDTKDSRVKLVRDSIRMFKEILEVKKKWIK